MSKRSRTTRLTLTAALTVSFAACTNGSDSVDVPGADSPVLTVDGPTTEPASTSAIAGPDASAPSSAPSTIGSTTTTGPTTTRPATTTTVVAPASTTATTVMPTTVAPTTPPNDPFLRPGDEGSGVSLVQIKLSALGYLPPGSDSGTYDSATADAVVKFQADYGLVVDGIVGPETERALTAAAQSINPDQP